MRTRFTLALALAAALAAGAAPAAAQFTPDPVGDFLPTYTGPRGGDLDVVGVQFVFTGSGFRLVSRSNAAIGTTPGAIFVWGINRGLGTARFASLGLDNVLFDAVVSVNPNGATTVTDLVNGGGAVALPPGSVSFGGTDLDVLVPSAFLPLLAGGFASPTQYTANLWPRLSTITGNAAISDFAPNNSNVAATVTPEPGTATLLLLAAGGLAGWRRRRRAA